MMLESLYVKTFLILSVQLIITFFSCKTTISAARNACKSGAKWVTVKENEYGQEDLEIDWSFLRPLLKWMSAANILVFFGIYFLMMSGMFFGTVALFCVWSILNGATIGLALIAVDENIGAKILSIAVITVLGSALVGIKMNYDFNVLQYVLFFGLLSLLIFGIIRIFINLPSAISKLYSALGVMLFTGYLIFDFNRLEKAAKIAGDNWGCALSMAIDIYLDIINLVLHLISLFSDK